ncbi:30S ribosomal protein-like protein S7 [Westerdykella ornata]|uniref:Small ribosomal subunit protein uS7m n=1 Tax=Westerdykella ornata TaxID=318751 RepID=A0A6A6JMP1_WESOR|nr:30S ribosomal protein-like protein S7 [Westerdykella ornata]KAF2276926.1 30S ribosomal protein-like protein S7 [Westerdykella ornata]
MPPRLSVVSFARSLPLRPRAQSQWIAQPFVRAAPTPIRPFSTSKDSTDALPHISEEAARTAKIKGEQEPDLEQGTPVEEVVKHDKALQDKLPKVMQDALKAKSSNSTPPGSRSYSTTTVSRTGGDLGIVDFSPPPTATDVPGTKFGLPSLPLPQGSHVKHRYDPVVDQVTNLLMRHGEKSVAQRNMALILQHLRTSPIPTINPSRPLLPGAPPPSHLPLNPVLYLTLAIDSVAPLLRIRNMKGAAGGGMALPIPVPLGKRQRRRTAVQWILTAASRRRNKGSGKGLFAHKVAEELISVVEGRSAVWERRNAIHKQAVAARANVVIPRKR